MAVASQAVVTACLIHNVLPAQAAAAAPWTVEFPAIGGRLEVHRPVAFASAPGCAQLRGRALLISHGRPPLRLAAAPGSPGPPPHPPVRPTPDARRRRR